MLRLVQLNHPTRGPRVAVVEEPRLRVLADVPSIHHLASRAIEGQITIAAAIRAVSFSEELPYDPIYSGASDWILLPPISHPQDPSRCLITGTGLTHKASADNRQSMHGAPATDQPVTDSMRMYRIGLEGGRPAPGQIGAQPEWFYKGTAAILRAHDQPLDVPCHAFDGGDEAEIAGVYLIGPDGSPYRVGLAQANEFSDHLLESQNYLYLAASKLRTCSLGPELVVGADLSRPLHGAVSVHRAGRRLWSADLRSGEPNMSHTLANLEHHHFKHDPHRRPGDLHVHFFGADVFSFRDKLKLEDGDTMTLSFDGFGRPLRNPLRVDRAPQRCCGVRAL